MQKGEETKHGEFMSKGHISELKHVPVAQEATTWAIKKKQQYYNTKYKTNIMSPHWIELNY